MYTVIFQDRMDMWVQSSIVEQKYTWAFRKAWQLYKKFPFEVVLERDAESRLKDLNAEKLKGPRH